MKFIESHARASIGIMGWSHPIKQIQRCTTSEVGGCSNGKSFRFVRACVRVVWLSSGIGSQIVRIILFPFPFWSREAFPFPSWARGDSPFPFPPTPQTSYPTLFGLIGGKKTYICVPIRVAYPMHFVTHNSNTHIGYPFCHSEACL